MVITLHSFQAVARIPVGRVGLLVSWSSSESSPTSCGASTAGRGPASLLLINTPAPSSGVRVQHRAHAIVIRLIAMLAWKPFRTVGPSRNGACRPMGARQPRPCVRIQAQTNPAHMASWAWGGGKPGFGRGLSAGSCRRRAAPAAAQELLRELSALGPRELQQWNAQHPDRVTFAFMKWLAEVDHGSLHQAAHALGSALTALEQEQGAPAGAWSEAGPGGGCWAGVDGASSACARRLCCTRWMPWHPKHAAHPRTTTHGRRGTPATQRWRASRMRGRRRCHFLRTSLTHARPAEAVPGLLNRSIPSQLCLPRA